MKKFISLIASLAIVIGISGCGGADTSQTVLGNSPNTTTIAADNSVSDTSENGKTDSQSETTSKDKTQSSTTSANETTANTKPETQEINIPSTPDIPSESESKDPTPSEPAATKPTKPAETKPPEPPVTTTEKPVTTAPPVVKPPVVTGNKGFTVKGTKLYDANGKEFIMRGVNHPHAWFRDKLDTSLNAIAKTGSNTVRIVLSDMGPWSKIPLDEVKKIVNKCKELKMIAVLEIHDATGKDEFSYLQNATDYWIGIKDVLIGNEAYVILNIANEWYGTWDKDSKNWCKGYTKVIPQIRAAGIKNTIMVDAAGWGQYAKSIIDYGQKVLASDKLQNTMFSIHMYGAAGKNASTIKSNINNVLSKNLCVIIGEFGHTHSDGDVDEATILSHCKAKGVGYLGWSWKGNGGGVEYLDIAKEWDGSKLSSDWGEILVNGKNGIRETSKKCTVFK